MLWGTPARREDCQDRELDYGKVLKTVFQESVRVKSGDVFGMVDQGERSK
jgi:hypothetical protein